MDNADEFVQWRNDRNFLGGDGASDERTEQGVPESKVSKKGKEKEVVEASGVSQKGKEKDVEAYGKITSDEKAWPVPISWEESVVDLMTSWDSSTVAERAAVLGSSAAEEIAAEAAEAEGPGDRRSHQPSE